MSRLLAGLLLVLLALPAGAAQDLLQTYGQALRNDTQLASAQAELGAAGARYRQTRAQVLPQLSASAGVNHMARKRPGLPRSSGDGSSITLNLSQSLLNWRNWQQQDAAAARRQQARKLLTVAEQALIVRTTQAYFEVLAARDALAATREQEAAIRQQLQRAQAAFAAGLSAVTDKLDAQSSLDAARVDAIAAENRLAQARQLLRALTGHAPQVLAGVAIDEPADFASAKNRSREAWLQLAQASAPTLDAAQAALAAAHEDVAAARGQRYPDIALVGSVGRSRQALSSGAGSSDRAETWSVGVQLEMPLFAGGGIGAAVDEAAFAAEQTRLNLVDTQRQLRLDVNTAWRDVQAAASRVTALDQAIKSASTAVAAARAGHRLGTRTVLDVIEAETELAQRKADRKQAWYDYALARLQLRQAAGVLDYDALARINKRLAPPPDTQATASS